MNVFSRSAAVLVVVCVASAASGIFAGGKPLPLQTRAASAEEEAPPPAHQHMEPDGVWFCHCGSLRTCSPCGNS